MNFKVSGGNLRWQRGLPSFGEHWEWSAGIAPALDIENRPLAEFIAWMAREHGWQVRYGDETLQLRTLDIRLHGSLDPAGKRRHARTRCAGHRRAAAMPVDGVLWVGRK